MQQQIASDLAEQVAKIRQHTELPIVVGFGISNPEQAQTVARAADGCVVGSAIVNQIAQLGSSPDGATRITDFVRAMVEAVKR